jgi:cell wall-associated NlpC family hydrolase
MSSIRIVRLAALVFAAATPFSLFAQALAPAPTVTQAGSAIDQLASLAPVQETVPAPGARIPLRIAPTLDTDAGVTASMDDIVYRAIYKTPRKRVADFAMTLRDIRYRRAGRDPATGFDCSGFTRYVYNRTYGLELPYDAPSQFHSGDKVAREDLKVGDLVFFGVRGHITHVGIYMGDGQFIHSPSPGKRVRVDELAGSYWAKRYAGARRVHVS